MNGHYLRLAHEYHGVLSGGGLFQPPALHFFYDGARAKTVGEVVASIAASMSGRSAPPPAPAASASSPLTASAVARAYVEFNAFTNELDGPPARAGAEAPAVLRESPASPASRLSALAMSVLQALDPARLVGGRESDERQKQI